MRRTAWALILIAVLVEAMALGVASVDAVKYVNGYISTNTTWSLADSPYKLTQNIWVNNGATLTIQPGVVVDLDRYRISIESTSSISAQGTSNSKIVFFSTFPQNSPSVALGSSLCTIDNAIFSTVRLQVNSGSSSSISNCFFTNILYYPAIRISGGSTVISNNIFDCQQTCIQADYGTTVIANNFIRSSKNSNDYSGIQIGSSASAVVIGNNVTDCSNGIYIMGNSTIANNLVTNNTVGIRTEGEFHLIVNNTVAHNSYGFGGKGTIANNTIGHNTVDITAYYPCNFTFNNIISETPNCVMTAAEGNSIIDAQNNWWGTTNESIINQTIYDFFDNSSRSIINYTSPLTEFNTEAPPLENLNLSPIPTPTPYPNPTAVPTLSPTPTPTPFPTPTPTPTPTSNPNATNTAQQSQPTESPPTYSPTPPPTVNPTTQIVPGSPLTLGSPNFTETIAQFDLMNLAKLAVIGLCIMWVIIILMSVDKKFGKPTS